jgi:hypothetical protein
MRHLLGCNRSAVHAYLPVSKQRRDAARDFEPTAHRPGPGGKDRLLCDIYLRVLGLALERLDTILVTDLPVEAKLEAVLRTHVLTVAEHVPSGYRLP